MSIWGEVTAAEGRTRPAGDRRRGQGEGRAGREAWFGTDVPAVLRESGLWILTSRTNS